MSVVYSSAAMAGWVLILVGVAAPAPKTDPRQKLETAIPEAIRLLEAKEYATFLKKFAAPDDLKKITKKASLDDLAKQFGENKAAKLLEVLKSIKDRKPTLDDSGNKATYKLDKESAGKKTIVWVKVDKHWYIQN